MEEKKIKKIGVLTSGGDAPGMNAAIRAVVRTALSKGMEVVGIRQGYTGLLAGNTFNMDFKSVSNILNLGGTILGTARSKRFSEDAGVAEGRDKCIEKGIDGLIVIGGDGSFRGARDLSLKGIPCIGVPGTIDNDISSSEYTVGFDTALNTIVECVDRLRDTSQSHNRCSVVEVMGRDCGDLAVNAAVACGAVAVLISEMNFDIERDVISRITLSLANGKQHFIVIVAEGMEKSKTINGQPFTAAGLAQYIESRTSVESRATILGHIQRGGIPTAKDRVIAARLGHRAVELLEQGIGNKVVVRQGGEVVEYDILDALSMKKSMDSILVNIVKEINI